MTEMTEMILTGAHIRAAEKGGACWTALAWLREEPRTVADLVAYQRPWAAWAAICCSILPDEVRAALEAAGFGRSWWQNGLRHRDDGPAVVWADGSRSWYRDGLRHRDDGPAIEDADGSRSWYRDGQRIPEPREDEK